MSDTNNGVANGQAEPQAGAQLNLQRIYIKNASFEAPNAPQVFQTQGQPAIELNLGQRVTQLGEGVFEVTITATVTCKVEDKTAYIAEVDQAGIFGLNGFDANAQEAVLASYCPNVLFPYARQMIAEMIQNGGFPPFLLQPINFESLYAEQVRRRAEGTPDASAADSTSLPN
ncbi:MAG: protein-export chaperone SecB [Dokdonella sp.]